MRIAQIVTLFLLSLVAGVFWGTWFSLSRSISAITPSTFLEVGRTMIANLGGPMSVLMPVALIMTAIVVYWRFRRGPRAAFALALAGFLLFVLALVVTLAVNVPIDREIVGWSVDTLPAGWTSIRDRWQWFHTIRTFASLAGLLCMLGSAVYGTQRAPGTTGA